MEFRVLGPLEVLDRDSPIALGAAKQRALLVLLLMARGEAVSADRLIQGVWGGRPPPTAVKSVQVYVSHLRKLLGDGRLVTTSGGYALLVAPQELDAERFEERLAEGRRLIAAGRPAGAAEVLRVGLAMWRGPPLADFAYEDFAQNEIVRLEELRLSATEERVDADLALGRHGELIAELEGLVRAHPLRERFRGQLMLALYRAGRQAEALETFRAARREMQDGLGIEPGPELRALQGAILRQDPDLDAPRRRRALPPPRTAVRARMAILAGLGVVVLAVTAGFVLHHHSARDTVRPMLAPDTVGVIDPATGRLQAAIGVPGEPDRLAAYGRRLWVVADDAHTLTSLDTPSLKLRSVVASAGTPVDVAAAAGRVWAVDARGERLVEVDPAYPRVIRRVRLPHIQATGLPQITGLSPWKLVATADAVWLTNGSRRLIRVDASSGKVTTIDAGQPLTGVTVAEGSVWAISGPGARAIRFNPAAEQVTGSVPLVGHAHVGSPAPLAIEAGGGHIWIANGNTADVSEIDPRQLRVMNTVPIGVEHQPYSLAVGPDAVWVADADGTLAHIDPAGARVVRFTAIAHGLNDVAVAGGRVWVTASLNTFGAPLPADTRAASAASRPGIEALGANRCSPLYYRPGDRPRLLIVSDLSLQTSDSAIPDNNAIQLALRDRGFQAGRYPIAYQACDNSTANTYPVDDAKCRSNARAYDADASVVGVIAASASGCAADELPVLNRAAHGPLAAISPESTYTGLTRAGPGTVPGEPATFAPTGVRGFIRLMAPDNVQTAADALLARRVGVRRAYTLDDGSVYGAGVTAAFAATAAKLRIRVVGHATYGRGDDRIAAGVRDAHPDGVFLSGGPPAGAAMLTALRRAVGPSVHLLASDGFNGPYVPFLAGPASEGLLISTAGAPTQGLPAPGRRFAARLRAADGGAQPGYGTVASAQSALVLLDAIARSDGTRRSVLRELFATKVHNGLLGSFAITPQGDTTMRPVSIYRITDRKIRYWKTITPNSALTGG